MGKADRYQKLYPVTWDQLHRDAKALAWRLLEQGPFKGIIGVARGGLVPAAIVARELNIRLVDTLCICTYQGREQTGGEEVLKAIEGDGDGWLVVDDLVDGVMTTIEGHPAKAGTPYEIRATMAELRATKEARERAGRPGLGV